jgi:hypothetical protein
MWGKDNKIGAIDIDAPATPLGESPDLKGHSKAALKGPDFSRTAKLL